MAESVRNIARLLKKHEKEYKNVPVSRYKDPIPKTLRRKIKDEPRHKPYDKERSAKEKAAVEQYMRDHRNEWMYSKEVAKDLNIAAPVVGIYLRKLKSSDLPIETRNINREGTYRLTEWKWFGGK